MVLPKSILLLGREIGIVEQDEILFEEEKVDGLYEHSNRRMLIKLDQNDRDKFETIVHEAAHSYQTYLGIDQTLSRREVEAVCQIMTLFVVDILNGFSPEKMKKPRVKK